ncbi:hypothetical protein G7068_11925 [Leucobacter viscericola]|uniref:Uncharacterized protein n=1 Tax=Leucobacter viscericola TaxID=2714935 RepID=A0A6G7XHG0_9MICO|nr:hypothetical protein [Leucobacter viscericola]QIK63817.1 hypothetical protein G7068_11925 [Leucobacter viscericola]
MTMTPEQKRERIDEARKLLKDFGGGYQDYPGGPTREYLGFDVIARLVGALEATPDTPDENDREALKRIAEVASVQHLKDSIAEYKAVTGIEEKPSDWELEFWHAGYKCGALAMIDHQLSRAAVPEATEPGRTLFYAPKVRNGSVTAAPEGFSQARWHQSAIGDTGCSHNLPGRLYVVQCEWCPKAFAANTKTEAMDMFREHESEMLSPALERASDGN